MRPNGVDHSYHEAPVRGLRTGWLETGTPGNPVAFLCHGFPDDAHGWDEQIAALSRDFHVIAPYVRGCDKSEPADDLRRYGTAAILLDHLEVLKLANVNDETKVAVIGHDLGAAHAIELGRHLGARLLGLIIINGTDVGSFARRLRDPRQVRRSWYMGLMQLPLIPETMVKVLPESCSWLAGELGGLSENLRSSKGFERRTLGPLNQYRAMARELPRQTTARPARIKAPLLVLWGRDDGLLEPPVRSEWERIALHVTIRILIGGHWLHREDAAQVNPIILDFLTNALAESGVASSEIAVGQNA